MNETQTRILRRWTQTCETSLFRWLEAFGAGLPPFLRSPGGDGGPRSAHGLWLAEQPRSEGPWKTFPHRPPGLLSGKAPRGEARGETNSRPRKAHHSQKRKKGVVLVNEHSRRHRCEVRFVPEAGSGQAHVSSGDGEVGPRFLPDGGSWVLEEPFLRGKTGPRLTEP